MSDPIVQQSDRAVLQWTALSRSSKTNRTRRRRLLPAVLTVWIRREPKTDLPSRFVHNLQCHSERTWVLTDDSCFPSRIKPMNSAADHTPREPADGFPLPMPRHTNARSVHGFAYSLFAPCFQDQLRKCVQRSLRRVHRRLLVACTCHRSRVFHPSNFPRLVNPVRIAGQSAARDS
jgi:hypothetical protein